MVTITIITLLIGYSYIITANGPIEPLGRDGVVKFLNQDMYLGHPHSKLLAKYADERGSKTALVVHFGGSSNYRSYHEDVYIIELAFIDTQGTGAAGKTTYILLKLQYLVYLMVDKSLNPME